MAGVGAEPAAGTSGVPRGTVTFCLTDIEDSTPRWNEDPTAMAAAVAAHDALITGIAERYGGVVVQSQGEGDSTLAVYPSPSRAAEAAAEIHRGLAREGFTRGLRLLVRIGLHTGEAEVRDGKYFGPAVNRAARIRGLGRGGQTVVSKVTAELIRDALPEGHELRDAGRHGLKGFDRPEEVSLLARVGEPHTPLGGAGDEATAPLDQLPVPPTSFVGREADRDALVDLVGRQALVTIVGPGGVGKTRLAVEVARTLQAAGGGSGDRGAGPTLAAVDLAAATDEAEVYAAVSAALGLPAADPTQPDDEARLATAMARGHLLVLLDNAEHVAAAVARLARAFLARRPERARLLVTSQVPLGVTGEHVAPLGGLGDGPDAVRLFEDRARSQDPHFAVAGVDDAELAEAVRGICARVDGVPLAIELAASHVRVLSPFEIRARLDDDPLALLTSRTDPFLARHRSVEATIDWSVGLLDDAERTLFHRLSVFEGGFTLAAAEAICAGGAVPRADVLAVLGRLVDRSLVHRRRRPASTRFWMLDAVRHYAQSRLTPSEPADPTMVLRRDGEVWQVTAPKAGVDVRLRDSVGLRHVARLVARSGREMHVLDLVALERPGAAAAPQVGLDVLDSTARRAYAARILELEEEADEAAAANDLARAERALDELDALTRELSGAVGLRGRARTTGSTAERARVSVTKAIRQAIERVIEHAPPVGRHLDACVRTGAFCAYEPAEDGEVLRVEP